MMRMRRGFTLTEMLIVLAIIGILASILFPVFGRVRENGRRVSCTTNMRQLGMAFLQYAQDHQDRLPLADGLYGWAGIPFGPDYHPKDNAIVEQGSLWPYVEKDGKEQYICPSNVSRVDPSLRTDYAMNCAVSSGLITMLPKPERLALLLEKNEGSVSFKYIKPLSEPIHDAGRNIAFLDGRVKWYRDIDVAYPRKGQGITYSSKGPIIRVKAWKATNGARRKDSCEGD